MEGSLVISSDVVWRYFRLKTLSLVFAFLTFLRPNFFPAPLDFFPPPTNCHSWVSARIRGWKSVVEVVIEQCMIYLCVEKPRITLLIILYQVTKPAWEIALSFFKENSRGTWGFQNVSTDLKVSFFKCRTVTTNRMFLVLCSDLINEQEHSFLVILMKKIFLFW